MKMPHCWYMKSRSSKNSSSVICKSLRKGEPALAGSGAFRKLEEESSGLLAVNLCEVKVARGAAVGAGLAAGLEKRENALCGRALSPIWLCDRKEVNGRGVSVFACELPKAEVPEENGLVPALGAAGALLGL